MSLSTPIPLVELASFLSERGNSRLHGFEDSRDTLASTNTHSDKCILATDASKFIQGLNCQDAACCSDWVTKRDPTTVGVCAIQRQVQLPHYGQSLCGKGFIEFDHIHVFDGQFGSFEYLSHGRNWSDAHVFRIYPSMCISYQLA